MKIKDFQAFLLSLRESRNIMKYILIIFIACILSSNVLGSDNQPDDRPVGYEIINNSTFHMWNWHDDYYINLTSGFQLTNHYENYWTKNTFCLGLCLSEGEQACHSTTATWIDRCTDTGDFTWTYQTDNESLVWIQGEMQLSQGRYALYGYINYSLDNTTYGDHINITIQINNTKNQDIGNSVRLLWNMTEINISNSSDAFVVVNGSKNLSENFTWSYIDWNGAQIFLENLDGDNIDLYINNEHNEIHVKGSENTSERYVTLDVRWDDGIQAQSSINHTFRWHDATCTVDFISEVPSNFEQLADDTVNFSVGGCWTPGTGCPVSANCQEFLMFIYRGYADNPPCGTFCQRALWRTHDKIFVTPGFYQCTDPEGSWWTSGDTFEMPYHDNLTDFRITYDTYDWFGSYCAQPLIHLFAGRKQRADVWANNYTPIAQNVTVVDLGNKTLNCSYDFYDPDSDSLGNPDLELWKNYTWLQDGIEIYRNESMYYGLEDDAIITCGVKVFDDTFETGNETSVYSSNNAEWGIALLWRAVLIIGMALFIYFVIWKTNSFLGSLSYFALSGILILYSPTDMYFAIGILGIFTSIGLIVTHKPRQSNPNSPNW